MVPVALVFVTVAPPALLMLLVLVSDVLAMFGPIVPVTVLLV